MAWTRLVQTGFEMGRAAEQDFSDSASPPKELSTTRPITGELSFYQTGKGGLGFFLPTEPTAIRCGFMFNTLGTWERVPIFVLLCREPGGVGKIVWMYSQTLTQFSLYYIGSDGLTKEIATTDTTRVYGFHSYATDIHIGFVIKTGVDGRCSMYINGQKILTFDADAAGVELVTGIFAIKLGETDVGFSGMLETHFDDLYVDGGDGSEDDVGPPLKRFQIKRPSGAGTYIDWTPTSGNNHEMVDEQIGSDYDYNYASGSSDRDYFEFGSASFPADATIDAVIPICRAKAGTPNPQLSIRLVVYDGAISKYGSEQELRLGYKYFSERMTTAPDGSAWDATKVNTAEYGYQLRT